ncbi:expressed unknown protein [Seminavis robusta]|uniref:Uncharacterized protein n=1 Tax=Seminavis robusta TaxID=568900 RepID=A0A9N8DRV7_9STRA|nr:expressed unknown protein [Seminavis robusta]|eukprot:Sro325_g117810.1 n/a (346) ;mRNA; r:42977-44014
MGWKKLFRKLTCRNEKHREDAYDERFAMDNDLLETQGAGDETQTSTGWTGKNTKRDRSASEKNSMGIRERYYAELDAMEIRQLYSIREVTDKYVDIPASFSSRPKWWNCAMKFVIGVWITFITADGFFQTQPRAFYLATFDHWANIATVLYMWSSIIGHVLRPATAQLNFPSVHYFPNGWHKASWTLFSIAAPAQLFASLAFWIFEYQGGDLEGSLISFGSVFLLLISEGLCLNQIPIRINHQWFFLGVIYMFLLWSLIHSYLEIGNPYKSSNDDSLYAFLNWNRAPILTAFYSMICLLIAAPLVYASIWLLSLFSLPFRFQGKSRRYLTNEQTKQMDDYEVWAD